MIDDMAIWGGTDSCTIVSGVSRVRGVYYS